ncbi:MAG TPA: hypothetical protein VHR39_16545 [Propionibacteriaceae bacterium]|nr:hypothetical protein [Propionibacteriaceae bacterium]
MAAADVGDIRAVLSRLTTPSHAVASWRPSSRCSPAGTIIEVLSTSSRSEPSPFFALFHLPAHLARVVSPPKCSAGQEQNS